MQRCSMERMGIQVSYTILLCARRLLSDMNRTHTKHLFLCVPLHRPALLCSEKQCEQTPTLLDIPPAVYLFKNDCASTQQPLKNCQYNVLPFIKRCYVSNNSACSLLNLRTSCCVPKYLLGETGILLSSTRIRSHFMISATTTLLIPGWSDCL